MADTNENPEPPLVVPKPKGRIRWTLGANSRVDIPILVAIAGLFYGIAVLHWQGRYSTGQFHELALANKRPWVDSTFSGRNTFLQKEIIRLQAALKKANDKQKKLLQDTITKYNSFSRLTTLETANLWHFNPDTNLLFFTRYFSVDRDQLLDAIKKDRPSVEILVKDTCCSPMNITHLQKETLGIDRHPLSPLEFFDRYPQFGFWFVLSIGQMSLWAMLLVLVIGGVQRTNNIESEFRYNVVNGTLISLLPAIIVLAFSWVLYLQLIDNQVIPDVYFQDGFNQRMYWYSIPGYLVAVVCFGAYLFLANKLELLNTSMINNKETLDNAKPQYKKLKSAFDFVFNCSAVILSVFVVWLGTLFSAVNNMEAPRFYTLISGKPLLNYDFVYLMGIIHSLLLAIFYFPVQIQFNSLELTKDDKATTSSDTNPKKLFKTFGDIIGGILITASPFITTIVQKALAGLLS